MRSPTGLVRILLLSALVMLTGCGSADDASPRSITLDPEVECQALYGPEPWVTLFSTTRPDCVTVGSHQDVQIWNKGSDPIVVEWFGSQSLSPNDHYSTGQIGAGLEPGAHAVEAGPYPMPFVNHLVPSDSISAGLELAESSLGPIALGMTVTEAAGALGQRVAVDPDLAPGPRCWGAVVVDDPYSPILSVEGDGSNDSVIIGIFVSYPLGVPPTGRTC